MFCTSLAKIITLYEKSLISYKITMVLSIVARFVRNLSDLIAENSGQSKIILTILHCC